MTPCPDLAPLIAWREDGEPLNTVEMLHREFDALLIPVEAVRLKFFRNRNRETFGRALSSGAIPLPVVTLDSSPKTQRFICIYQLAAYIEHHAIEAAKRRWKPAPPTRAERRLQGRLIAAVPITDHQPAQHRATTTKGCTS